MNFTTTSFGARFALSLSIFLILTASLIGQTTPQLTLLKDIQIGTAGSNPENLTSLFNKVVFTADDGVNGKELWASDGTQSGTILIKDFVVGSGSPTFSPFVELGGTAFFTVTFNETPQRIELWKTDGTPLSTLKVFSFTDALPNITFSLGTMFTANNKVYIPMSNVSPGQNISNSLWESNGFTGGTRNLGDMTLSFQNEITPSYYYEKGQPIFCVTTSNSCSNPLATGSIIVIDSSGVRVRVPFGSASSPGACYAKTLGVMGRNLYFLQANTVLPTPTTKVSLFKVNTDGVKTVVIDSFSTYSRMTNALSGIRSVASNNWLYFFYEMQMWKSDGTTLGTVPLTTRQSDTEPTDLMTSLVDGDVVYFTDNFSRFRYWRSSNGTKPVLISSESSPLLFVSLLKKVGNKIYSFGSDPTDMPNPLLEIKSSDGQTPFIKIAESRQIRFIPSIGAIPNFLFFGFNDATKGLEIGTLNLNAPVIAPCDTDRIAPVISSCPQNINLTTTGTSAVASWTTPTATDNCTATPSVSSNYTSGSPFGIGTTTVTYTATDAKNNTATCSFTVNVSTATNPCTTDVTPPVLSSCPANISLTTTGTTAVATWTAPTATDNCTANPPVSSNYTSGSSFGIGTTAVTYTATDVRNNTATCRFNITVSTSTATANCASKSSAPWNEWIAQVQLNTLNNVSEKTRADRYVVGYSDWKDKTTTLTRGQIYPLSITPGLSWASYQTNLFFRAWIDYNGNGIYEDTELVLEKNSTSIAVNQSLTIPTTAVLGTTTMRVSMKKDAYSTACETFAAGEVEDYSVVITNGTVDPCATDVTPPALANCPANISVTTTGTTAVATWTAPTATDNCTTTPPSVSSTFSSGQSFPIGTTAVVYTARDAANNTATCAFSVVVSASTVTANCVSKSNAPWNEWISNVQFNTLNNTSSKTRDDRFVVGYSDWKDKSTTVSRSQTYPLSITPGLSWAGYQTPLYFRAWIDFNRNGIYEDTELVLEKNSNSAVVNQSVTIPATAAIGTTTMRVSMKKGAYATACESFDLGEVEDYTIVIQDGNPISCANNVLNFDGVDDYLQTVQNMIPANSNFTMEASFTSTATTVGCSGSFKRLLALELSNSPNRLEIGECSGQLTLYYFISGGNSRLVNISTASNLRDGNWHHVAAVKNGDALSIYYDGTLVLTELGLLNINNVARALYVGRWGLQGENWQGNVDEVRVWNYAVSATDIVNRRLCQLMGSETGLVLYFPFNQGVSGGSNPTVNTVIDKSPSNITTLMTNFGLSGATSNWVCSTQTLTQGCTTTDPCANDVISPVVVNCPQNIVLTNTTNQCQIVSFTPPSATDNCTPPAYSAILKNGSQFLNFTPTINADLIIGRWDIGSSYEKTIDAAGNILTTTLLPASNGVTSVFQNGVYTTLTSSGKWELSADGTKFIGDKGAVDERYYKIIALSTTEWKEIGPYRLDGTPYFGNKLYEYWASKKPNMFVNICPNIPIDSVLFTFNDTKGNKSTCSFKITVTQPVNSCRYNDSLVLVDVYNSMGGANWVNKWDLTKPMNTWLGIGTDTNGCVIAFSSGQLTGNLAPSIGNLSQLRYMRLGGSRAITGTIPNNFANLSNLIELQIEDNQLTGSIPSFVGNLRNLNQILLYKNMLTGPIPSTFGNLNKMQWLILNNNQLSGTIPSSMSNMTLLNALELSNNSFTGSIPNVFGNIPSLTYLGLKNNNFSDTLPKNLARLTNINKLDLSNNLLSGCIPNELKPLCGKDVILSGNINLPNSGDWAAFCSTNAGACPVTNDLEVSVVANAPTFKKWTNTGFKVNLKNLGSQAFTNIELTFPYPTGTVNGGTPTPSVGTFQQYCAGGVICYKWTIPSLAAGTTATLDVPLFALDVATIIGTAQLLASTPTDVNAANNTATATMTLQTIVPSLTSKPTQLIPVVIQTLSPNPTDGELSLKLESLDTREVTFEFYNALGKAVKSEKRVVEKGLNRVDFSLFDLEQGVYFIVPSTGQGRKVPTKFVKL